MGFNNIPYVYCIVRSPLKVNFPSIVTFIVKEDVCFYSIKQEHRKSFYGCP